MSDYISRQAAIEAVKGRFSMPVDNLIVEVIGELPSAQPEIIRCKDCKHYEIWQLKSDYTDDKRYKPSVCVVGRYAVHRPEDWFCGDAKRRTDEIN